MRMQRVPYDRRRRVLGHSDSQLRADGERHARLVKEIARRVNRRAWFSRFSGSFFNYHRQDVYHLGQSAQRLFDDSAALDQRIEQVQAQLGHIKQCRQMGSDTTPQEVFGELASTPDLVSVQNGVDAIVQLLGPTKPSGWFRWLLVLRGRKKIRSTE